MNNINNIVVDKGYIEESIPENFDIKNAIKELREEKNAVILAHYYQIDEIQDIADFVGDSLKLAQEAEKTNADVILFAGVHFMAETAKIIAPERKVLIPDLNAGCSLADSCPPDKFADFVKKYPDHTVISYVNTTAEIKALSDIICTSSNAKKIIEFLPEDENIIFAPDRNLGNYIKTETNRDMIIWEGACHVHEEFSLERILQIKSEHPEAKIIAHPECEGPIRIVADHIGSTSSLLKYTMEDENQTYIVATESGIIHQMKKANPDKMFIAAPPKDVTCGCSDCNFMKLITLKKIYLTLKYEQPEIFMDEELRKKAEKPIQRMLEISSQLQL